MCVGKNHVWSVLNAVKIYQSLAVLRPQAQRNREKCNNKARISIWFQLCRLVFWQLSAFSAIGVESTCFIEKWSCNSVCTMGFVNHDAVMSGSHAHFVYCTYTRASVYDFYVAIYVYGKRFNLRPLCTFLTSDAISYDSNLAWWSDVPGQTCPTKVLPMLVIIALVQFTCRPRTRYSTVETSRGITVVKCRFRQSVSVPPLYNSMTLRVAQSQIHTFWALHQLI